MHITLKEINGYPTEHILYGENLPSYRNLLDVDRLDPYHRYEHKTLKIGDTTIVFFYVDDFWPKRLCLKSVLHFYENDRLVRMEVKMIPRFILTEIENET